MKKILILLLLSVFTMGASYEHTIFVTQDPDHDSTLIIIHSDSADEFDSTVADNDTILTLNDVYNYIITEVDF